MKPLKLKISFFNSTTIVLLFGLFLGFASLISEFFQAPKIGLNIEKIYQSPIDKSIASNLTFLKIKNNLGEYQLQKIEGKWELVSPRELHAKTQIINDIVKMLQEIEVKRLYSMDPINVVNFNLNSPTFEITIGNSDKQQRIKYGLINSIDDSTYINIDDNELIHQIPLPSVAIESLILVDFIDNRVFAINFDEIDNFEIYRGKNTRPSTILTKKDNEWIDQRKRNLDVDKVKQTLEQLLRTNSRVILDKRTDKLEEEIKELESRPLFKVIVEQGDTKHEYSISQLVKSLDGVSIERRQNVVITSSNLKHPVILPKSFLNLLEINTNQMRESKIKKLLY